MCKKFKSDHTNKWYIHNPESALENETNKILGNFGIQTDHLISARRPDQVTVNNNKKKATCLIVDFADYLVKLKESEKKNKYLELGRELKKIWNIKVTVIPIVIGALGTVTKGLVQGLEDLEIRRRVETIQTTALSRLARILSSGDLRRLAVTQDPGRKPSANAGVKKNIEMRKITIEKT